MIKIRFCLVLLIFQLTAIACLPIKATKRVDIIADQDSLLPHILATETDYPGDRWRWESVITRQDPEIPFYPTLSIIGFPAMLTGLIVTLVSWGLIIATILKWLLK